MNRWSMANSVLECRTSCDEIALLGERFFHNFLENDRAEHSSIAACEVAQEEANKGLFTRSLG